MKKILRICMKCKEYTLMEKCPKDGENTISPHPSTYSPDDKYANYRTVNNYPDIPKE